MWSAMTRSPASGSCRRWSPLDLPALELGSSTGSRLGDSGVFADGQGRSIRTAIVAKQEFAGYWEYLLDEAIFTAPAHPSWGGAGLIGADGKLIGIGSLRLQMSRDGEVSDINMAVPIDLLPPILDDMKSRGEPNRPPRPGSACSRPKATATSS